MPDLIPGAMSPPLDDGLPSAPQRPDAYDARRSAEALRELERQHEHDPERPRSRWEKRWDSWSQSWIDVEVESGLPPVADPDPAPSQARAPSKTTSPGREEDVWAGLA